MTHQEDGWLVEKDDPAAIAEAIITLSDDPERCALLLSNAKIKVDNTFGMAAMLGAYQKLYSTLL